MTLRELYWRYEGIVRERWAHTAEILAMLHNCHRDGSTRPANGRDYNPTLPAERVQQPKDATPSDLAFCRKVFAKRN